ncbi:MAG: chemotaxis protein CheW [Bacteroidetes bacterium]|nr:chemotaxis protein CheW [Bacteroidota bacterium]
MAKLEAFKPSETLSSLLSLQQADGGHDLQKQRNVTQCIVVLLGREQVAIPIRSIKEIIEVPKITYLPNVPDYILGICSVRGEIISITDIRLMLNLKMSEAKTRKELQKERVILLDGDRFITGVVVDTVVEVIEIPLEEIESSKNTLTGRLSDFSEGIYKEGGRILVVMNVNALLNSNELAQFNY